MSILKSVIASLANVGSFEKEVTVGETKFVLRVLDNEQMLLADSLVDANKYLEKTAGEQRDDLRVFQSTIDTLRSITRLAFVIKAIDGVSVVKAQDRKEQIKEIEDFRDDIARLDPIIVNLLNDEYNQLVKERTEFFSKPAEITGK